MKPLSALMAVMAAAAGIAICEAKSVVTEVGPYTVQTIDKDIYHIMDCNSERPAGVFTDKDGKPGFNNISDMYIVLGDKKALLIDLSNKITWADNAEESLRNVVAGCIGKRELTITVTHAHGDHTGMAGAFAGDPAVKFLLPAEDFYGKPASAVFPAERTTYFPEGYRIDLGKGAVINTLTVSGHTKGSTVFFLEGRDVCFTGDAIGSGSGAWIFDYESLLAYAEAVPRLSDYIYNPANGVNPDKIVFYGGHSHQKGELPYLGKQYLDDMVTLLEKMQTYSAKSEAVNYQRLNRNYNYGQAWITLRDIDAVRYYDKFRFPAENDVIGRGPSHRAQMADLLAKLDEHKTTIDARVGEMKYYLYDPVKHGADPSKKYPLIVVFHGANNGHNGVRCAADSDCYTFIAEQFQKELGGAYILFPKANEGTDDHSEPEIGTWMTFDKETGKSLYIPSAVGIINEVVAGHSIDAGNIIVGGTSAGGFMTWQFLIDNYKMVKAAFLMAPAFTPTKEQLDNYAAAKLPIWIIHGRKDAICRYDRTTGPNESRFMSMPDVRLSVLETVRYGDKGMVYLSKDASDTMGQHLALFAVGQNMIYDDGTPYDPRYPEGISGWMKDCISARGNR